MAIELVSFPIENGDFPHFLVCLPESTHFDSFVNSHHFPHGAAIPSRPSCFSAASSRRPTSPQNSGAPTARAPRQAPAATTAMWICGAPWWPPVMFVMLVSWFIAPWKIVVISSGWWLQPLWKILYIYSQLGWLFPINGKNVPNHQPVMLNHVISPPEPHRLRICELQHHHFHR